MNPWENIELDDYESHMSLSSVFQLQKLDDMMKRQLNDYSVSTVCILGIAGGNGLRHVDTSKIDKVYGVDINQTYLNECVNRYPDLTACFCPLKADLTKASTRLPRVDMVIANLFVEYVGYDNFVRAVKRMSPKTVSCIIQVDTDNGFVSDSIYAEKLSILDSIHITVDSDTLIASMDSVGYLSLGIEDEAMPNGKCLRRMDFMLRQ